MREDSNGTGHLHDEKKNGFALPVLASLSRRVMLMKQPRLNVT
jgi:hypothetical protein